MDETTSWALTSWYLLPQWLCLSMASAFQCGLACHPPYLNIDCTWCVNRFRDLSLATDILQLSHFCPVFSFFLLSYYWAAFHFWGVGSGDNTRVFQQWYRYPVNICSDCCVFLSIVHGFSLSSSHLWSLVFPRNMNLTIIMVIVWYTNDFTFVFQGFSFTVMSFVLAQVWNTTLISLVLYWLNLLVPDYICLSISPCWAFGCLSYLILLMSFVWGA